MWSIGSITAALLTGDVVFTDRAHPMYAQDPGKVIMSLASECNLDALDHSPTWAHIGRKPKDFVKNLLVLEESKRMTVTQALEHPWIANKYHKEILQALYERATCNWRPRRNKFQVVERLSPVWATEAKATSTFQSFCHGTPLKFCLPPISTQGMIRHLERDENPSAPEETSSTTMNAPSHVRPEDLQTCHRRFITNRTIPETPFASPGTPPAGHLVFAQTGM